MSGHNVELHRRAVEAFNARDVEAAIAICDPLGGDELRREPEAYFDLGERTLLLYVARARGRQSGVELTQPAAVAAKWRDGLCVYLKNYVRKEDALSDLGVSENALGPIEP